MTVLEAIQRGSDFLSRKGVDAPRLQAEWLLAHTLGLARLQLYLQFDRVLTDPEIARVRELFRRRGQREPLQHLLGTALFCGLELAVSPAVLVPRPETELLAEAAWRWLEAVGMAECQVLDFGTGSGCLAIALAHRVPRAICHAVELSEKAAEVARANAAQHALSERVLIHTGDGFAALPRELQFNLIVSNPPYIPTAEIAHLDPEVRDHDPRLALDGGEDGLVFFRRLSREAGPWMGSGGRMMVEVGDGQSGRVAEIFAGDNWVVERVASDYSDTPRILTVKPGARFHG